MARAAASEGASWTLAADHAFITALQVAKAAGSKSCHRAAAKTTGRTPQACRLRFLNIRRNTKHPDHTVAMALRLTDQASGVRSTVSARRTQAAAAESEDSQDEVEDPMDLTSTEAQDVEQTQQTVEPDQETVMMEGVTTEQAGEPAAMTATAQPAAAIPTRPKSCCTQLQEIRYHCPGKFSDGAYEHFDCAATMMDLRECPLPSAQVFYDLLGDYDRKFLRPVLVAPLRESMV